MSKLNINFNNKNFEVSDSALSDARADFISHLGTIAGEGLKIVVNNTEYFVDPTKLNDASSSLETVLEGLSDAGGAGGLEPITWDGVIGDRAYGYLGMSNDSYRWVKVSDRIFTPEELVGANINVYVNAYDTNYSITVTEDMLIERDYVTEILDANNPLLGTAILYIVVTNGGDVGGTLQVQTSKGIVYFPSYANESREGLYCLYIEGGATSTLTFPS